MTVTVMAPPAIGAPGKPSPTGSSVPTAPRPTPSDSAAARAAAARAQAQVTAFQAQIAKTTASIAKDRQLAELAQQDYLHQQTLLVAAKANLVAAQKKVVSAKAAYGSAHASFVSMIVTNYEGGGGGSLSVSALISAKSPADLLNRLAIGQQISQYRADVASRSKDTLGVMNSTDKAASKAKNEQRRATVSSKSDLDHANSSLSSANFAQARLVTELKSAKTNSVLASAALQAYTGINGGLNLAQEQAISAKFQARATLIEHSVKTAPNLLHWTAAAGQTAADRALAWVGLPYSWAGGNASGPTSGVCSAGDGGGGENDCGVWGFDCSGLVIYGWGPYLSMAHFAASQYSSAGSLHPAISNLMPGDLVFWSTNRSASGIAHVAVYVGHGDVVQAPESGDVVKVTPVSSVQSGLFGATRPLT